MIERPQGAYHLTSTVFEAGILQELVDRLSRPESGGAAAGGHRRPTQGRRVSARP